MKWAMIGNGLAVACAVHCLALPVVAGAACCASESPWANPWAEAGMLGATGIIGLATLGLDYRIHQRSAPLALLIGGLLGMVAGHTVLPATWNTLATVAGALAVVSAQLLNRRCTSACSCCPPALKSRRRLWL